MRMMPNVAYLMLLSIPISGLASENVPPHIGTEAILDRVAFGISAYISDCKREPESLNDLLVRSGGLQQCWNGPYVYKNGVVDDWGRLLVYSKKIDKKGGFKLQSLGQDGVIDSADDIIYGDVAKPWRAVYGERQGSVAMWAFLVGVTLATLVCVTAFVGIVLSKLSRRRPLRS